MNFTWNGAGVLEHVTNAATRALSSAAEFGHEYWDMSAPISDDPRTSGDLRRSWFDQITRQGVDLNLEFGARTRYAIYVELGTSKMGPRAPVRTVAGEISAIIPSYFANELRG